LPVIHVLLVDDHQVVREGLKHMLAVHEDIQVVGEAGSGEEALAQAQRLRPDVVLMDIKMPGMDGIAATRQLREKVPETRVVILTLYGSEYLTQAIEAGASGYILKDASGEQLVQAIRDAYQGHVPLAPSLTRGVLTRLVDLSHDSHGSFLSDRQCEILRLVAAGLSNKDIGARLCISEPTVKKELTYIFDKLGVSDRAQAVSEAVKRKLI